MIGVATSDISVLYTPTNGTIVTVSPTAYAVSLNAPVTGQIWGVGGTISPVTPSNYSSGSLTIVRTLPFTQQSEIGNQGNEYPIVTETALDTLCMQIQQVSSRTGSYRGVWATNITYNYSDIAQDGVNGTNSGNYYLCVNANTSGVWATDLANGYWVLIIPSVIPSASFPISISNGGTGQTTAGAALNALGGISLSANNTFTGTTNTFSHAVSIGGTLGITGALSGGVVSVATSLSLNGSPVINKLNVQVFTTSGTYTPTHGMVYCIQESVGGGGGGAGLPSSTNGSASAGGSGGYSCSLLTAAQIGSSQTVTIGAAGTAGSSSGGNGGAGGTTSLGSLVSCTGGGGGNYSSGSATGAYGGTGGTCTVGGVVLKSITGQAGANCESGTSPYLCINGPGGSNPLGFGAPSTLIFGSSGGSVAANSPTGFGSGGGAPAVINGGSSANQAGTTGMPGYIVITEFVSA